MSLQMIHLRKLLKIMYLEPRKRVAAIRNDIRDDINRENDAGEGGGDFYGPFWRDAKDHVFGTSDLHAAIRARVESNAGRANLYPQLRDGFLLWWNQRRRWTNEPFRQAQSLKTRYPFPGLNAIVKVDNLLAVRDAHDQDHFVYPYFSPDPTIQDEAARLGLWLLGAALPNVDPSELRILDVIRGQTFSIDRNPLMGDEQQRFRQRYEMLITQWQELRREYD